MEELIVLFVIVLVVVWLVRQIPSRTWHCPECGYQTNDEAQAMGHKVYHATKHTPYEVD